MSGLGWKLLENKKTKTMNKDFIDFLDCNVIGRVYMYVDKITYRGAASWKNYRFIFVSSEPNWLLI